MRLPAPAILAMVAAVALSGCSECPEYGPYGAWTDDALYANLLEHVRGEGASAIASSDAAVTARGYSTPAHAPFSLGNLASEEVASRWGRTDVDAVAWQEGAVHLVLDDHSVHLGPGGSRHPSLDQARRFLDALMEEPEATKAQWAGILAQRGHLPLCRYGDCLPGTSTEKAAWSLRLDALFNASWPWAVVEQPPTVREHEREPPFEDTVVLAAGPWTFTLVVPSVVLLREFREQPWTLQVAADGLAEFRLRNQPWGDKQDPRPTLDEVPEALGRVLAALGHAGPPGADYVEGPGRFDVSCYY